MSYLILVQVRSNHGIDCLEVILGNQGLVVKTTSGKVSRSKCKQQYQYGIPKGVVLLRDTRLSPENSAGGLPFSETPSALEAASSGGSLEKKLGLPARDPASGSFHPKKILVVGAGPAGLTAAYQLTKMGHKVRVVWHCDLFTKEILHCNTRLAKLHFMYHARNRLLGLFLA